MYPAPARSPRDSVAVFVVGGGSEGSLRNQIELHLNAGYRYLLLDLGQLRELAVTDAGTPVRLSPERETRSEWYVG